MGAQLHPLARPGSTAIGSTGIIAEFVVETAKGARPGIRRRLCVYRRRDYESLTSFGRSASAKEQQEEKKKGGSDGDRWLSANDAQNEQSARPPLTEAHFPCAGVSELRLLQLIGTSSSLRSSKRWPVTVD
ncbi:uncharacterized protein LOC144098741 isoform X2 [Amblyomma americanum]